VIAVSSGNWMMFVDGENFTLRAQELARRNDLDLGADPTLYSKDVFVWMPGWSGVSWNIGTTQLSHSDAVRGYFYTSVVGDDLRIVTVKQALRSLRFDPQVFKRLSGTQKSKGVDIALTKDMLSHAFLGNYQNAVLIAGDADYIPLVEEVKRRGKRVFLAFFSGEGLGLSEDLKLAADSFVDLTDGFLGLWRQRIEGLRKGGA
jgi:uncharacterized LabA/DUF88 family protein